MAETIVCPVCQGQLNEAWDSQPRRDAAISCRNCGDHVFTFEALKNLPGLATDRVTRARIGHAVRKVRSDTTIRAPMLDDFATNTKLPEPLECIDNLVMHMATDYEPGEGDGMNPKDWGARLGCIEPDSTQWVISQASALGLIAGVPPANRSHVLTAKGWQRHAELLRAGARSRHAFMAMRFGDADLDALYQQHLQPAVADTGFKLRTVNDDHATAGSIDDRMRVEIRTARFMVCDLTHGNQGAYWEAGFAEGIGRPVFYICRSDLLGKPAREGGPHFDTAHQLITGWSLDNLPVFLAKLKAAIRATLPDEAWLEDRR